MWFVANDWHETTASKLNLHQTNWKATLGKDLRKGQITTASTLPCHLLGAKSSL